MLVMGLTGYIRLWFGNPPWAVILHDTFFTLITAILLLHVYTAILDRGHRPLLHAMFTDGRVPAEFVKDNVPLWYREVEQTQVSKSEEC